MIGHTIPSICSRLRFFDGFQLSTESVSSNTLLGISHGAGSLGAGSKGAKLLVEKRRDFPCRRAALVRGAEPLRLVQSEPTKARIAGP